MRAVKWEARSVNKMKKSKTAGQCVQAPQVLQQKKMRAAHAVQLAMHVRVHKRKEGVAGKKGRNGR